MNRLAALRPWLLPLPMALAPLALAPVAMAPLAPAALAQAQGMAPACAEPARPWQGAAQIAAAARADDLPLAGLAPGAALRLRLLADPEVDYLTLPRGAGEESSFGGLAAITIPRAGRYMIGLEKPAWVDLARDGLPAETVGFGPGPRCSGIAKQVSFDLAPGDYVLEVSGNLDAEIGVILLPLGD